MHAPPLSLSLFPLHSQVAVPRVGVDDIDKLDELIARLQQEAGEERRRAAEESAAAPAHFRS